MAVGTGVTTPLGFGASWSLALQAGAGKGMSWKLKWGCTRQGTKTQTTAHKEKRKGTGWGGSQVGSCWERGEGESDAPSLCQPLLQPSVALEGTSPGLQHRGHPTTAPWGCCWDQWMGEGWEDHFCVVPGGPEPGLTPGFTVDLRCLSPPRGHPSQDRAFWRSRCR